VWWLRIRPADCAAAGIHQDVPREIDGI